MEAHHIPLPTKITRLNSGIDDSLFIHEKMGTKMTNARTNKKDLESSKKMPTIQFSSIYKGSQPNPSASSKSQF
jgi:hypothetical protein